jgi:hypothetical protein
VADRSREKGVSVIVGFVLILQALVIFISFVQTTLVPDMIKKAEAENIVKIADELAGAGVGLITGEPMKIKLSPPEYPDYLFLLTPEPAAYSAFTDEMTIKLEYNEVLSNGSKIHVSKNIPSKRLYIQFNNYLYPDSTFIIENTAVLNKVNENFVVVSDQKMIGNYVNLVVLDGNISLSYNGPTDIVLIPASFGGEVYAENITITFPSINPDYWQQIGMQVNGSNVSVEVQRGILRIFEYKLKAGISVTLAEEFSRTPYRILKQNPFDIYNITVGESKELGVVVLDYYNNPVPGVKVNVSVSGSIGDVIPASTETDTFGRAYVEFRALSSGSGNVTFSTSTGSVVYRINVFSPPSGGRGVFTVEWLNKENLDSYYGNVWDVYLEGSRKTFTFRVTYNGEPIPGAEVAFLINNSSVIDLDSTIGITNTNGEVSVTAFAKDNGSVKIFGLCQGSGDLLNLSVQNVTAFVSPDVHILEVYVENLLNQPLNEYQVRISIPADLLESIEPDGRDLRVAELLIDPYNESDGKLPYWVEQEPSTGTLVFWTKLNLSAGENKTIYVYWNKSGAISESNGIQVFNWFDDFNGAHSLSDYTIEDVGNGATPSDWQLGNGILKQNSNIYFSYSGSDPPNYNIGSIIKTPISLDNFEVRIKVMPVDNDAGGVAFNYINQDNYYAFGFCAGDYWFETSSSGYIRAIYKQENYSTYTYLSQDAGVVSRTSVSDLIIRKYNGNMEVYQDGSLILSASDSEFSGGVIGLFTNALSGGEFHPPFIIRNYADPEPKITIGERLQ